MGARSAGSGENAESYNDCFDQTEPDGRLESRAAIIGIVGLGYVGQPLALRYSQAGFAVIGFDIDEGKVAQLNGGSSGIEHIDDAMVAQAIAAGFAATTDFAKIRDVDAIILCVPTPLNKYREPDLSFVTDTMRQRCCRICGRGR